MKCSPLKSAGLLSSYEESQQRINERKQNGQEELESESNPPHQKKRGATHTEDTNVKKIRKKDWDVARMFKVKINL